MSTATAQSPDFSIKLIGTDSEKAGVPADKSELGVRYKLSVSVGPR